MISFFVAFSIALSGFFVPLIHATEIELGERQFRSPAFVFVGCFTNNATFPTALKSQSFSSDSMTLGLCTEFCGNNTLFPPNGFGFAGLTPNECFCDGVIQLTATAVNASECNLFCQGDKSGGSSCGGNNRISVFTNGAPSPGIPTASTPEFGSLVDVPGQIEELRQPWNYVGCYSDNAINRTLQTSIPGRGINVHECAIACTLEVFFPAGETFPFYSGTTNGGECWCGTFVASTAQRVPDIACASTSCLNNVEACGGESAMLIYEAPQLNDSETTVLCSVSISESGIPSVFELEAIFSSNTSVEAAKIGLVTPEFVQINTDGVNLTKLTNFTVAGILSFCPGCIGDLKFNLSGIKLLPDFQSSQSLIANPRRVVPPPRGGQPNFVQITSAFQTFGAYCVGESRFRPGQLVLNPFFQETPLPFSAPPDASFDPNFPWVLCVNETLQSVVGGIAPPNQDVVFKPLTFQPGFNLTQCKEIELRLVFPSDRDFI
ncbi:hypothetical protein GALMADRAFT_143158 [Galerina marginata CBS 339.88]|uniref:WSC domain-containing protein n=1 Tax=Galerina marginata (strain CBS 339.88) TaxID=685588 RepID=A0A067SN04_GALM3|nr:hypothetical protein GALMADRAFT_143158 [Galerina marginata CBS 339.88]